ncbi:MAG: hypothetical protein AMXMBFR82_12460 [Candidatus Hydrogenedentota bacterium]
MLRDGAILVAITAALAGGVELAARIAVAPPEEDIHDRVEEFDVAPKEPGTFRILTYGGSTTAGYPRPELGFAMQLESALRRSRPETPVEVINLGYSGKSSVYVRAMVGRAEEHEPDLLVVLSGHNEYLNRTGEDQSLTEKLARAAGRLAIVRFAMEKLRANAPEPLSPDYFLPEQVVPYDRSSPWYAGRIANHEANLKSVADWAQSHDVPVIFCTPPANLAEWPPIYRRIDRYVSNPDYYEDLARVKALRAEGRNEDALTAIDKVIAEYGEDAMFAYLRAYACRDLGRLDEAYELYWRAIELDPFPQRVLPVMNEHIRALRDEANGVYIADVAAAFEAASENRFTGLRLVGDNVHPTLAGHALVAREIARTMAEQGLFLTGSTVPESTASPEVWLQAFMDEIPSPSLKKWQNMKVAQFYSNYCQKYPFYYFELALQYQLEVLERAKDLDQDNWGIYGEVGTLLIMNGRVDEGIEYLRNATALKGSPLDPGDHGSVNWIPEALQIAGITLESLNGES